MKRDIQRFTQNRYDVLIIGGGINGAAVAHMSALNGLKVALLEKGDFASGASGKSTKLIHGGLRYLENMEFGLVHESLRERTIQLKSAPHLVRPLRFIIPVYDSDARPFWLMKLGVRLYDLLSQKHIIERHRALNVEEICRLVPGIRKGGLLGGVMYSDAQMNDARLCLENVLSAVEKGANAANYVNVSSFIQENGRMVGVHARDELGQKDFEVRARKIVCAVGPWTNILMRKEHSGSPARIRPTKGVHIVYKGKISDHAVLIPTRSDRRIFFIIPWMGNSLIGTTDTDFTGDPDRVEVERADIDYLLAEAKRVLPGTNFNDDNIITSFAGLRPLVSEPGAPARVSRKHMIKESYSGLIYVMGGKYTTYRKIAEDVVRKLTKKPFVHTREKFPVYGSGEISEDVNTLGQRYGVEPEMIRSLINFYGVRFSDVIKCVKQNADLKVPICSCCSVILAQVVYAIETEMARTVEDIIMRRLVIGYKECPTGECRKMIRSILSEKGF
ncbi:MAG: glycerol-3-phosphate dehydrogenase/oxidase [Candidatus Omnitrophica bacterium]|nr:glycerol-3-phosphate dehydrogenase/oxidase [Candidatus Omnitrophota bacterium]